MAYVEQKPNKWKCCINGLNTSLRDNPQGFVECMSNDKTNCLWQGSLQDCNDAIINNINATNLNPLTCGEQRKLVYGELGYGNQDHWCMTGFNTIKKSKKQKKELQLKQKKSYS